ncbi:UDP-N-acetylmuramate dehydrogenase [soil metagenome]
MTPWDELVASGEADIDVSLAGHTTYKLGGPARLYVEVADVAALSRVARANAADPAPILVLGRGSNLLVSDDGFDGVVVRLGSKFSTMSVDAEGRIDAGGALPLPRLARGAADAARGGLEWCVGVPGSVGGAVRQNAGCFGSEVVDCLIEAEVVSLRTGGVDRRPVDDLEFGYRHSNLAATDVVTSSRFATVPTDPDRARALMLEVTRWRRRHQPGGTLNAGSVFKNPPDEAAGALIDRLGLKGFSMGKVRVSPRHANFIEAEPGARAADVRALIDEVQARVAEAGVELEREIQYIGFGSGQ